MSILRILPAIILSLFLLPASAFASGGFGALGGGGLSDNRFLKVDEAFRFSSSVEPGLLKLHWSVADGYYLYKDRIKVKTDKAGVVLEELRFSIPGDAKEDPYFGLVQVFHQDVTVEVPILSTGGNRELEFQVSYQGCAEEGLCYPPQTRTALYFQEMAQATGPAVAQSTPETGAASEDAPKLQTDASAGSPQTPSASNSTPVDTASAQSLANFIEGAALWQTLGLFFLLGVGLAFTPCVFPMIPILSSIIAGQKQATTGSSFILSLAYVLGVAAMYATLGFVVGWLGAGISVQAYLQEPWILSLFAALFVVLALSMFGFYELQLPAFLRDRLTNVQQNQSGGTLFGVFLMGVVSALVVSPCVSAPLAGALVYIATTGDAGFGAMVLFALALGMGLPLVAVGTGAGRILPKAGAWMVAVKAVFGVLLLGVAVWLLERFMAGPITLLLWALLAGVSAVYLGAFAPARSSWQHLWKGLGLMLFVYSVILLVGVASGASDPLRPIVLPAADTVGGGASADRLPFITVKNLEQLAQQVELATNEGRPAMVDVYADWCISCKVMERDTFPAPQVRQQLSRFRLIKADVTANDEDNQELLKKFGLFGPPGIIFYDSKGRELAEHRIYGEIKTQDFVRHLGNLPQ